HSFNQLATKRVEPGEPRKNKLSASADAVAKGIDKITTETQLIRDQLNTMLSRNNVAMGTWRSQIAAQIAWSKTVEDQYGDQVKVSPANVDAELARISAGADKPHFRGSEIFL